MKHSFLFIFAVMLLLIPAIQVFSYESVEEEIEAIQKDIDEQGLHWYPRINPIMTEYTPKERLQLSGFKLPDNWKEIWESHLDPNFMAKDARDLPPSFNWEDSGKITGIRNQGSCGSCWIFSSVAALEASYKIYRQLDYDLSEQQLLSCISYGWGCEGGWMEACYEHFRDFGAIRESDMPYQANDLIPCAEDPSQVVATVNGWTAVPQDVNSLKTAVMTAPVAVAFTVYDNFHSYGGGCYYHEPGESESSHAVLIVGWDDDMCDGNGAWRVKNSWGLNWGEDGYFWIQYGCCDFGYAGALLNIDYVRIADDLYLPDASVGDDYNHQMTASGGTPPYHWSVLVANLPHGLSMDGGGLITGIPEREERYTFALRVQDSAEPPLSFFKYHYLVVGQNYTCCDLTGDGESNLIDVLMTIGYLYDGAPAPADTKMCDCDCSRNCNLLDILYLIDFLYGQGDPPCQYWQ